VSAAYALLADRGNAAASGSGHRWVLFELM